MSQKVYEDINFDEYLVTECDGPGCNEEFRTLIERHDWPGNTEKIKLPFRFSKDEEGWKRVTFKDDDGNWIREDYCPECAKKYLRVEDTKTTRNINELINEAHRTAILHGWWNKAPEFGTLIALCHSELSEALEEYRNGMKMDQINHVGDGELKGIPIELADVCIRIFDICGQYNIDLEEAIREKMEYNKGRPFRHGGKKC